MPGALVSPLFESFEAHAKAVSAEVHRFASKSLALEFIRDLLRGEGVSDAPQGYALWSDGSFLSGEERERLATEIPGLRFQVTRELAAGSKVGISQMDWGIADTGTLVQDATAVEHRLVSTLSLIHVAILATARIVADMPSVLKELSPAQAAYCSMITGPSRTADIERVLTIGVHGPERLIIVAVDELERGAA
jgi:L-lactate dehydrogenase complex protein LldG